MKVILQDKVANLGVVGAQVNVRPGYARNYLIPTGRAVRATDRNLAEFDIRNNTHYPHEHGVHQAADSIPISPAMEQNYDWRFPHSREIRSHAH